MIKPRTKVSPLSLSAQFPSSVELKTPATWNSIIEIVKDSGARRHSSLSKEFVWIFGLTSYHNVHRHDFRKFCTIRNVEMPKSITPASILKTILLEYTGKDLTGRKNASKYKTLILPSLKEGLTLTAFEQRVKSKGGVFNLSRKTTLKKSASASAASSVVPAKLVEDGHYWVSAPDGETLTVVLKANHGPHTLFDIKVISEPQRRAMSFGKAIPLDDIDDEDADSPDDDI